jgi:hypothetical protein
MRNMSHLSLFLVQITATNRAIAIKVKELSLI